MINQLSLPRAIRALFAVYIISLVFASPLPAADLRDRPSDEAEAADSELQLQRQGWVIDSLEVQGANLPGVRHLVASGRIAAPPESVWEAIASPPNPDEKWPNLKEMVLERVSRDGYIARYTMAVPIYADRRYRLRTSADPSRRRFTFEMLPGYGNVHQIRGYWDVAPLGESDTRVTYVLDVDPGVKFVPEPIIDWVIRNAVPHSFEYLLDLSRAHSHS